MLHRIQYDDMTLTVNEQGSELTSFTSGGREYIWQGEKGSWMGHSPILFPVVGALKDNTITFEGEPLNIFKHGFAARKVFSVDHVGEDEIRLSLHADEETLKVFPFEFSLTVTFRIIEKGFSVSYEVRNNGSRTMPFCIGGHPGIALPMEDGYAFEDYMIKFEKEETGEIAICPDGGIIMGTKIYDGMKGDHFHLDHSDYDREDALIFTSLKSRKAQLINEKTGHGVEIDFHDFPVLSFWTMPHRTSPYICLEPWHGMNAFDDETGRFEDKPHAIMLKGNDSVCLGFSIRLI